MIDGIETANIELDLNDPEKVEEFSTIHNDIPETVPGLTLDITGEMSNEHLGMIKNLINHCHFTHISIRLNSLNLQNIESLFNLEELNILEHFAIEGFLTPASKQKLFQALPRFTQLHSLFLNIKLSSAESLALMNALTDSVKVLDIHYGTMNHKNTDFVELLEAIRQSGLKKLVFGTTVFSIEDANLLADKLEQKGSPFEFELYVSHSITPDSHSRIASINTVNPLVSITFNDPLNFLGTMASFDVEPVIHSFSLLSLGSPKASDETLSLTTTSVRRQTI